MYVIFFWVALHSVFDCIFGTKLGPNEICVGDMLLPDGTLHMQISIPRMSCDMSTMQMLHQHVHDGMNGLSEDDYPKMGKYLTSKYYKENAEVPVDLTIDNNITLSDGVVQTKWEHNDAMLGAYDGMALTRIAMPIAKDATPPDDIPMPDVVRDEPAQTKKRPADNIAPDADDDDAADTDVAPPGRVLMELITDKELIEIYSDVEGRIQRAHTPDCKLHMKLLRVQQADHHVLPLP